MSYVESLTSDGKFSSYCGATAAQPVASVLHISPLAVLESPLYKAWMNSFPPTTQHIIANKETSGKQMIFNAAAANQTILNSLHQELFPTPQHSTVAHPLPSGTLLGHLTESALSHSTGPALTPSMVWP